ncbi:unnamed protein product [Trifolium pratense]|uniref:Uncharacterized protein n=1 Tax=Trifolium pratense TaxID=57577 RepID=A0ACB0L9X8_TRIPR|nr:unnamed protein product [Trifolium pratense]
MSEEEAIVGDLILPLIVHLKMYFGYDFRDDSQTRNPFSLLTSEPPQILMRPGHHRFSLSFLLRDAAVL